MDEKLVALTVYESVFSLVDGKVLNSVAWKASIQVAEMEVHLAVDLVFLMAVLKDILRTAEKVV